MSLFTQKPRNSNTVTRKGVRTLDIVLNFMGIIALCGIGILWWLNILYEPKPVVVKRVLKTDSPRLRRY